MHRALEETTAEDLANSGSQIPSWAQFLIVLFLIFGLYSGLRFLFFIAYYWQRKAELRMETALKLRQKVKDHFRDENGYSWDFVFVFKVSEYSQKLQSQKQRDFSMKNIILRLADAGLQTKVFYSAQNDEVYCKVRAPLKRLFTQARAVKYKLQCDPINISNLLSIGNRKGKPERMWGPISIRSDGIQTEVPPYDFIYATYMPAFNEEEKMLYARYGAKSLFRGVDRIKLLESVITNAQYEGGCGLNIYDLQVSECIIGFFPIHDIVELSKLEGKWFVFWMWPSNMPINEIKNYFGEKIGFLTGFVAHYTGWMMFPAFCGFCTWINVAAENDNPDVIMAPIYAFGMAIWATLFLESWKRKEGRLAMEWGVFGDAKVEKVRSEYIDNKHVYKTVSAVDGQPELYFPRTEFVKRQVCSTAISAFFVMCVIALVGGMFAAEFILAADPDTTAWSSTIAGMLNASIVIVMGAIYSSVTAFLNEYENHRTTDEFEDALISKIFIVQFINNFASLFFIAFGQRFLANVKGLHVRRCTFSCMKMLQQVLSTLFLTKLATGCATQLIVPYVTQRLRERAEFADAEEKDISALEREFLCGDYDLTMGPFQDYADYTFQFAYTTMFISAYPLATTMALVNNYVMMRVQAWFFCHLCKRPVPSGVNSIGTWFGILEIISYIAVVVSAGLVAFTGDMTQNFTWTSRVWMFFAMSGSIILVKLFVQAMYPRVDDEVHIQLARQKFIMSKLFDNMPDDDDTQLQADVRTMSKMKLEIRINDDDPC